MRTKPIKVCIYCRWHVGEPYYRPSDIREKDHKDWERSRIMGWPLTKKEKAELAKAQS